jgi:hypothetical protein
MEIDLQIAPGPPVQMVKSRDEAEAQLRAHPAFPKHASVEITQLGGRWIAAVATPKLVKEAEFPPPAGDEGPPVPDSGSDSGPDRSPEPKDEGKDDKPKDDKPKEEKGEDHLLTQVFDMLQKITDALGLSDPSSPVPGMDEGPAPDGPPAPPMDAPPAPGEDGKDAQGKQHVVHERSLKPGEAPPGSTPVGAPAFASVQVPDNHPWAEQIKEGAREIILEDVLGSDTVKTAASELRQLAEPVGYRLDQIKPFERSGVKHVYAKVVRKD